MKKPVKHDAIRTVPAALASVTAAAIAVVGILFAAGCAWSGSPTKPADEVVPVTAYLTATNQDYYRPETVTNDDHFSSEKTVTITDRSTVAQIAKLINALPVAQRNIVVPCPTSPAYVLDFRAAENSPPVAQVWVACLGVMITGEPDLGYGPAGVTGFVKSLGALIPSLVQRRVGPSGVYVGPGAGSPR
jgi:hypothetical protein